jgi:S-adenosylmethionine-diacylglycerol 3-amino-3-carboxypropyl transferase
MTVDTLSSPETATLLRDAVGQRSGLSFDALKEWLFARLFKGLVYAQIWEDPEVDLAAMALSPAHHVVTIASGGCNALSYLTANPRKVTAVDLSPAHVALVKLKIDGLRYLPSWQEFYGFFGAANDAGNIASYQQFIAPHLAPEVRAYWEGRKLNGARRISGFRTNIYRQGVLGRFIWAGQFAARLYGVDLRELLKCQNLAEQRAFFESGISPLLGKGLVRHLTKSHLSLFGLGIPPQQYEALAEGRDMLSVLHERLERLACGFPLSENYFTWQAFGNGYAPRGKGPLPPYLQERNFEILRRGIEKLSVQQINLTHFLTQAPRGSVDRFVLLDAQDWMSDAQLNDLWRAIASAAAPGARVIFRTAGTETILPGRIDETVLSDWNYLAEASQRGHARDRSSIYGGFHVYERRA